jgi:hypothetical protein
MQVHCGEENHIVAVLEGIPGIVTGKTVDTYK